jgi:flagellum-specific peptidoglycan hydrolase FlgJ
MKVFLLLLIFTTSIFAKDILLNKKPIDPPKKDYKVRAREVYDFWLSTEYKEAAEIITAMTVHETYWYKSQYHNDYNNYYSKKITWKECLTKTKPIECMTIYKTLDEANIEMSKYFKKKGYLKTTEGFYASLIKYGYAVDPEYTNKVRRVVESIRRRNIFNG